MIRLEYIQNNRIECLMNPAKSFRIEESYINLAIVETKERQEKEKILSGTQQSEAFISTYEEIYDTKTMIDINDIFEKCKGHTKKVLVLGRAGIGKSTFCQYITYQWATGALWPQYDLVILIPLHHLTESRYPPLALGSNYSLIDLIKKEYFDQGLSENDEGLLKENLDKGQVLWLLDGYDEIVQNIPTHLQYLFEEQLLKTPHHILTSRPYMNTLSYNVTMEIIGFTDDSIAEYVEKFFHQIKDELEDSLYRCQTLWSFLKQNPNIWGLAHIPVNLEVICNLWTDTDWSETKPLTITALYDNIIEWLYRRYLKKKNIKLVDKRKRMIYELCHIETQFLENLAFHAMVNNIVLLPSKLLKKAENETNCLLDDHPQVLNIGILESHNHGSIGHEIEKDHYFVHLSFQEYFAARYLVTILSGPTSQKAIDFIKHHKYNQRFALMFTFVSGILIQNNLEQCIDVFWDTILGSPVDLIGLRHIQLIISCIEETSNSLNIRRRSELIDSITKWIKIAVFTKHKFIRDQIQGSLQRSALLAQETTIQDTLIKLLESKDPSTKINVCSLISKLPISNPNSQMIHLLVVELRNENEDARRYACDALKKMSNTVAINDVINDLLTTLDDENWKVRQSACEVLAAIGAKSATTEVINRLVIATGDEGCWVRHTACQALEKICNIGPINTVINRLVSALSDESANIRKGACEALQFLGKKAATSDVINRLLIALSDENDDVRQSACEALGKMGEISENSEVINILMVAAEDKNKDVRRVACGALGKMGEKAVTNDVISKLVTVLSDEEWNVRSTAYYVLNEMGKKAATNDLINGLVTALLDKRHTNARKNACLLLRNIGVKAATNEVINGLVIVLRDDDNDVKETAFQAVASMGDKAATKEMINGLVTALGDENDRVRESACDILGNMSEKAATNGVINRLVITLSDENLVVRVSACAALWKMGVKAVTSHMFNGLMTAFMDRNGCCSLNAAYSFLKMCHKASTNDVINELVTALSDENENVREGACHALHYMGEEAATNDVIKRLMTALSDEKLGVRLCACAVLKKMGEKAATSDVINRLVIALSDENDDVKLSACEALGNMGERAPINEVVNTLVIALRSGNDDVKKKACDVLKNMGDKMAIKEMINGLVSTLSDDNDDVRQSVCEVLGKMGEKAATNNVINRLVMALSDENERVRENAWEALENMGEKAATNEMINSLGKALRDKNENYGVRKSACKVLSKIGGKAATNDVINWLVTELRNKYSFFERSALEIVEKMGEKVATNDMIDALLDALANNDYSRCDEYTLHYHFIQYRTAEALEKTLVSFSAMTKLDSNTVSKLCSCINRGQLFKLSTIPSEQLIQVFLNTKNAVWLPVVTIVALLQGSAITISENTIVVYGSKERVEIQISSEQLRNQLVEAFDDQTARLYSSPEPLVESREIVN